MRTTAAMTAFVLAAALNLLGATLAGVTLPESVIVGDQTLVLNGMGLRTRLMFKVYVGGLYLLQKSTDANVIIQADAPKQVTLHFLRSVSRDQMVDAYRDAFANNAPEAHKTLAADIERLMAAFEPVTEGDVMTFVYVPGIGTTLSIRDKSKVTIAGLPFARAMFSAWLGPKPPSQDLKKGMLGQ
jgi:hypothetical protein